LQTVVMRIYGTCSSLYIDGRRCRAKGKAETYQQADAGLRKLAVAKSLESHLESEWARTRLNVFAQCNGLFSLTRV
jgi:hypothetical protein